MEKLKYTIIKTKQQYNKYCDVLEVLIDGGKKSKDVKNEIELLTFLIEKYDNDNNTFSDVDPITILKSLMTENKIKGTQLAELLGVSEGLVSDMLHYRKGLSKETIRILAQKFKLNQEVFNKPYKLVSSYNSHLRNAKVMNVPV